MLLKLSLAIASVAAYTWLFNNNLILGIWLFGLLAIHEYGHMVALKYYGMGYSGPYYLPFIGAAIFSKRADSHKVEFIVSIAGPVFGLISVFLTYLSYVLTNQLFFAVVTIFGTWLNLFNLIPAMPLDGGRILNSVLSSISSPKTTFVIMSTIVVMFIIGFVYIRVWILAIVGVLGLVELYREYDRLKFGANVGTNWGRKERMDSKSIAYGVVGYVALVTLLIVIMILSMQIGLDVFKNIVVGK